jgi:hypothetical protein
MRRRDFVSLRANVMERGSVLMPLIRMVKDI